jgi:hypothetical protein
MKWTVIVLSVLALAGCRLSINKWGGIPPRAATDRVKIAVHDNGGAMLAKRVLEADSRVEVIAFDPAVNLKERDVCGGSLGCPGGLKAACQWSYHQGADYYALASQYSNYSQTSKCVKSHTDWSKVFDKSGDSEICDESVITSQGTTSTFAIKVYDTYDCEEVPQLSQQVSAYASGEQSESGIESQMSVGELAPTKYGGFPDQTSIAPSGQVVNAPGDGEYALFHNRTFQGIARLHHSGTPREHIHMLMCCEEPVPGDVLVRRGPMKFIEFDVSYDAGILSNANSHQVAQGLGIHLRHRRLGRGLELGINADTINSTEMAAGLLAISGGYGDQITPLFHLAANAELGFAKLLQDVDNPGGERVGAWTPYVMPQIRAQIAVRWWYLGLDLGYAISSTVGAGDWSGLNAGNAVDARLRGPVSRLYTGITL